MSMNTEQQRTATIAEIESTIRRLRSVASARVRGDERGEIEEIHVVTDDSRHPKQVSRDIESLLLSELGLRVDHRKISIAQLRETSMLTGEGRLKFVGIDLSIDRTETEVKVSLGCGEDVFVGSARCARPEAQLQVIAQATAGAINEYLACSSESERQGAEISTVLRSSAPGIGEIITVLLRVPSPRGDESLVGSAIVKDSAWHAAAYATLDALNRRIARLIA